MYSKQTIQYSSLLGYVHLLNMRVMYHTHTIEMQVNSPQTSVRYSPQVLDELQCCCNIHLVDG